MFLGLTASFLPDVRTYFQNGGTWRLLGGSHHFSNWNHSGRSSELLSGYIHWHAVGMLVWMLVVVYQLATRGSSQHKVVGYLAVPILWSSLGASLKSLYAIRVPALHGMLGCLTLFDTVLLLDVAGIAIETTVAILKVRRGQVREHRQHAICAVLFSAGPGLYRLGVYSLLPLAVRVDDDPLFSGSTSSDQDTVMVHELSVCLAIMASMLLLLLPATSGHMTALFSPSPPSTTHYWKDKAVPRPAWQKVVAVIMLVIPCLSLTVFGICSLDLLLFWWKRSSSSTRDTGTATFLFSHRSEAPRWFNLVSLRS